jgi:hypothetical protein
MSSSKHAQQATEEQKKHGDVLEQALKEADRHNLAEGGPVDAVPAPDNGGHAHSQAAHLTQNEHLHNNALKGGHFYEPMTQVNAQKQPPQEISRVGKQHRGQ